MKCRTCQTEFHSPVQTFNVLGITIKLRPINCTRCIALAITDRRTSPAPKTTTTDLFA